MTHIEIHKIKGRNYLYEVTNYREGKKVKHKWRYLGAVEPVQKRKSNVGKKPTLKTRELNQEEKVFVEKSIKHSESFIKDRAKIIELSSQANSVKQICEKLKFDRKKIGEIINAFNKNGLKVFKRKRNTGRPRRITKEQRAKMIEWLNTHPKKLELHFNNWSCNKLSEFAKKNNIKVSPSQIGRIIEQDEIKYKTKRSKMYSNDKNFLKNIRQ
ncbi:helix-turn-helix domain-containing protein [Candidatus Pacearchaeota archaeon]|nr:helix-turn-helix domain-containing protein [Candidatus Pacearchaeota archaeon]